MSVLAGTQEIPVMRKQLCIICIVLNAIGLAVCLAATCGVFEIWPFNPSPAKTAEPDTFKTETTLGVGTMVEKEFSDGSKGWMVIIPIRRGYFPDEKVPNRGTIDLTISHPSRWDVWAETGNRSKGFAVADFDELEKFWVVYLEDFIQTSDHVVRVFLKPKAGAPTKPTIGAVLYSK